MAFRRGLLASALVVALAGATGCIDFAGRPYTALPDVQRAGLVQRWETQIGLTAGERVSKAWRVGDSVYVTTTRKRLVRIVAASGVKAWDTEVGVQTQDIFRPADISQGQILVLSQGTAFVLDKAAGVEVRARPLNMIVTTDPLVDVKSNTMGVGAMDYFYGMFLDQLGGHKWVAAAPHDMFTATPAIVGDSVLLATREGRLSRVGLADGQWDWKDRKTNGPVVAPLSTDGGILYVPALDQRVYAFNAQTGGELWQVRLEGTLNKMAVPVRTQLLVPATGKGLYSLSTETGDTQWVTPGVTQIATVSGNHVWAEDEAGNLKSVSLENGEVLSSTPIPAAQLAVYNTQDDLVILVNKSGVVGAFAPVK
jgi:outer membrane protein assembly factor BamB